ncbi:MAG: triose-phosphate isomerase, partial [Bdellovibrionaceae bacterium]|nr:triose-phosphate isomerase [Pseudobdellovibrionaceae bacterium]
MKKIIAANWKLNKGPKQAEDFVLGLKPHFATLPCEVIIFPSAFCLPVVAEVLRGTPSGFGPQNVYARASGAFTGENSAAVAKELGSTHVLIGHSERRTLFAESDELIAEKVQLVQGLGMTPVLCIGENLSERESGKTDQVNR